ncbi:unnamed protein product [Owenia fusiformis]|uniref:Uncharacterized protein n=1 Tax=Owenia fusiformis TaxID=6347 RepID=A0A8S4P6V4_OWEFU|nr:unnamed protein product [Owenia fusiformis]
MYKILIFSVLLVVSYSAPVPNVESAQKIDDLKSKLARLQEVLRDLNVQEKPTTPTPKLSPSEEKIQEIAALLSPSEVELLRSVKAKLAAEKQKEAFDQGHFEEKAIINLRGSQDTNAQQVDKKTVINLKSLKKTKEAPDPSVINLRGGQNIQGDDEGYFDRFQSELLEEAERRLLADLRYAKDHNISIQSIIKDIEAKMEAANKLSQDEEQLNKLRLRD